MNLLVDIGNTRIKWALQENDRLHGHDVRAHADWSAEDFNKKMLSQISRPQGVWVANVVGESIESRLNQALMQQWGLKPNYARSSSECAGVRNGYVYPQQLGVDRWLNVIAAYHMIKAAACVVSMGTATTIDAVDAQGRHLGGSIVPGTELMTDALLQRTGDIARRIDLAPQLTSPSDELFADNTQAAVRQGARHALAALVERAVRQLHLRTQQLPQLVLTGGGVTQMQSLLQVPCQVVDDLTLRGLAYVASQTEL